MVNSSSFQEKIITHYFFKDPISNNIYISVDNFNYQPLNGKFNTDLYLLKNHQEKIDTILFLDDLKLKVSLLDILFSRNMFFDKIEIDSPKLFVSDVSKKNTYSIHSLFSFFSKLEKDIFLSDLKISNIDFQFKNELFDSIDIEFNSLSFNQNQFTVDQFSIRRDSSFLNISAFLQEDTIDFSIDTFYIDFTDEIFISSFLNSYLSDSINSVSGFSDCVITEDSLNSQSKLDFGNSELNFDFSYLNDSVFLELLPTIVFLNDFDRDVIGFVSKYIDSLNVKGNLTIPEYKVFDFYTHAPFFKSSGSFQFDFGEINYNLHTDSLQRNSNLSLNFIDFDLGRLLDEKSVGSVNMLVESSFEDQRLNTVFLQIDDLFIDNYVYNNISIQSTQCQVQDELSFKVLVNDQNLDMDFDIDFVHIEDNNLASVWKSKILGKINEVNLKELGFKVNHSLNFISTNFLIDIPSSKEKKSIINLSNFYYEKDLKNFNIDYVNLTINEEVVAQNKKSLSILINSSIGEIQAMLLHAKSGLESLYCDFNLIKATIFSDIFFNDFDFNDSLKFNIDYYDNRLSHLFVSTPSFHIENIDFFNIDFSKETNSPLCQFLIDEISVLEKFSFNDFDFSIDMTNPKGMDYTLIYSYLNSTKKEGSLTGKLKITYPNVVFNFDKHSFINFSDQSWYIDSSSTITISQDNLFFQDFAINLEKESLFLKGYLDNNPNLSFSFQNFNLDHFNLLLPNPSMSFTGLLNGNVLFNKSGFPMLGGNFDVTDFTFNNILLGDLSLNNYSNAKNDSLYSRGVIKNDIDIMDFSAQYPLDGSKNINIDVLFKDFPIDVLDVFIQPVSQFEGLSTGKININGPIDDYGLFGNTYVKKLKFSIPYLNNEYYNDQDSMKVTFNNDSILISEFTFSDMYHNTIASSSGFIQHKNLKDMSYVLNISSDSLFTLNTDQVNNENYFGRSFIAGDMVLEATPEEVTLNIDGISKDGSILMIPLSNSKEIIENKFLHFSEVDMESTLRPDVTTQKSNFNMNFNLDIGNSSEIQLIFDEEMGDLIKGYGQGDLSLKIDDNGSFQVFGDFIIEKGNYLFTLQDVITKSFEIEEGGTIKFNGDPYNATIDLNLLYNVQASLNPLNADYDRKVKSPVICKMKMTNNLLNPDIDFSIEIPKSDQIIETSLEMLTNTEQKLLEQFLYLLIANSFLIENDPSIDYLGNTLATTGTELLSNQLSNWLSQTTDLFDLGFKWVPGTGDSLSYQQVELAVSKKFLDDRVIVNGNVGTPPEQSQTNIIGDLDIEYNFFGDGRLKLRVFNRAKDYDPLSESLGYEQGFGIFFKKQFNSFKELFKSKKNE